MFENPTRVMLILAAFLMTFTAAASSQAQKETQQDTTEELLKCDGISDAAKKMACFDAVVQGLKPTSETPVAETQSAAPAESDNSAAVSTAAAAAAAVVVPDAATGPTSAVAPAPRAEEVAEPAAAVAAATMSAPPDAQNAAATTATAPDGSNDPEDNFGLEGQEAANQKVEVQKKENEIDSIHATIVEVWPTIDNRFEVRLDNGQVWRETELTRIERKPRVGSAVRITRASLGGFRMKIGNDNRLAAVRRTE